MLRDEIIDFVLMHPDMEGGDKVSNSSSDPGGVTKYGISKRQYPTLDIVNLTKEMATKIALRDYWKPAHCDDLVATAPGLAACVFDTAFNSGSGRAIRILQEAVNVTVDGVFGNKTMVAVAAWGDDAVPYFLARRGDFMRVLPNWTPNAAGWLKRLFVLHTFASKLRPDAPPAPAMQELSRGGIQVMGLGDFFKKAGKGIGKGALVAADVGAGLKIPILTQADALIDEIRKKKLDAAAEQELIAKVEAMKHTATATTDAALVTPAPDQAIDVPKNFLESNRVKALLVGIGSTLLAPYLMKQFGMDEAQASQIVQAIAALVVVFIAGDTIRQSRKPDPQ